MSILVEFEKLGLALDAQKKLEKLEFDEIILSDLLTYCCALMEENTHTNLVAKSSISDIVKEHVLDSLTLLPYISAPDKSKDDCEKSLVDVGSGAGFPGIILAIVQPDLKVCLIDSVQKKCRFLEKVKEKLHCRDRIEVICARAEQVAHQAIYREKFDFATARAVASLDLVAELTLPFLSIEGLLLSQRSQKQIDSEFTLTDDFLAQLSGEILQTVKFEADILGRALGLIIIKKIAKSSKRFPRNTNQLKKKK